MAVLFVYRGVQTLINCHCKYAPAIFFALCCRLTVLGDQLTGPNWRFYFVAAMMITLEAANFRRALGQSHYIKLDTRTLRTDAQLYGIDATLIQSEKGKLSTMVASVLLLG